MKKIAIMLCILVAMLGISGCSNNLKENSLNLEVKNESVVKSSNSGNKNESENKIKEELVDEADKADEVNKPEDTKIVEEEPMTIVIDPGHSSIGNSEKEPIAPSSKQTKAKDVLGATGVHTNIPEHITTVSISNIVKDKLVDMGFNVVMTKTKVEESISNIERAQIGNQNNADLVVRIHADGAENHNIKGASMLIPPKNKFTNEISDISKEYGEKILNVYTNELEIKNRGTIYRDDMTGFNWSNVPVVILEMGFLSNKEEDLFLSSKENHESIANAIAKGILSCFITQK